MSDENGMRELLQKLATLRIGESIMTLMIQGFDRYEIANIVKEATSMAKEFIKSENLEKSIDIDKSRLS